MIIELPLNDHWIAIEYSLNCHWMIIELSLNDHWIAIECSLNCHWILLHLACHICLKKFDCVHFLSYLANSFRSSASEAAETFRTLFRSFEVSPIKRASNSELSSSISSVSSISTSAPFPKPKSGVLPNIQRTGSWATTLFRREFTRWTGWAEGSKNT